MQGADYFKKYRDQLPAVSKWLYFNSGAIGPTPEPVYKEVMDMYQQAFENGGIARPILDKTRSEMDRARKEIADFINAEPEEILFTRSVSDGLNMVNYMIPMGEGDEMLISTQENPAVFLGAFSVGNYKELKVNKFAVEGSYEEIIENFKNAVTPRTKLATFSHVLHTYGYNIPVRELCAYAREHGVYTAIDGAQAAGNAPIDVKEIGCDFYAVCTHKWLGSIPGVGIMYIRKEIIKELRTPFGGTGVQKDYDFEHNTIEYKDTAERFEFGARPDALYVGVGASMRFAKEIGLDNIYARQHELNHYARKVFEERLPEVRLFSTKDERMMTGIFTIAVPDVDQDKLIRDAWAEKKLLLHPRVMDLVTRDKGIRISLNWFITEEEIDKLVAFIREFIDKENKK